MDDPDGFKINRFQMEKKNTTRLAKLDPQVDWKYSYLAHNNGGAKRRVKIEKFKNKNMTICRIQFLSGPYVHHMALTS